MHPDPGLIQAVTRSLGRHDLPVSVRSLSGGDINRAFYAGFPDLEVFVKYGGVGDDGFAAEAAALDELRASASALRVPRPLAQDQAGETAFLVLEWMDLEPPGPASEAFLGRELARLHATAMPYFGWHRRNFIGATLQPNPPAESWPDFFLEHRLRHQARLLGDPAVSSAVDRLAPTIVRLLGEHSPFPSLLHGDLWGGNRAATGNGQAAIFDPASYYGCRETDLAMSELFGGFSTAFYQAYDESLPLHRDYPRRRPVYQLYHVLNHANLFGGGYRQQALRLLESVAG